MNPYYDPEKLELELISFDEPNMDYEYNKLCFWATKDGQIYSASDSGCSCPVPFEDQYDRPTREEVIQTLERVGSAQQAEDIFDAWNKQYDGSFKLDMSERRKLTEWVTQRLKP